MSNKLELSLAQTAGLLERAIKASAKVALIGPPGVGKTTAARKAAERLGVPCVILDGGNEASWKRLMPYKTPEGTLEPGLAKSAEGGVLVIDEFTRIMAEGKSLFQTLAGGNGHCLITWPDGHAEEISLCLIATGNTDGVGVEEVPAAELDRYDFIVWVMPTDEEAVQILADHYGQPAPRGRVLWDACKSLARRLDSQKFHKPEGLRFAIALAKGLNMLEGMMSPSEVFRSTAERTFPLGKRGAERWRSDFETLIVDEANDFERKLGSVPLTTTAVSAPPSRNFSFSDLANGSLPELVTAEVALPFSLTSPEIMVALQQGFGLGAVKAVLKGIEKKNNQVVHRTMTVNIAGGKISFHGTAKSAVQTFARAALK